MKKEDKELLLNDLHARLKYQVKGLHREQVRTLVNLGLGGCYRVDSYEAWFDLDSNQFKPYLRPLHSMTEEEKEELQKIIDEKLNGGLEPDDIYYAWALYDSTGIENMIGGERFYFDGMIAIYDWLNEHYFDYRGLIKKGLALEAPEGMYYGI